jgi:Zn-dependent protease with chaperone function
VLLDELVVLLDDDEETAAVLAHELGHAQHRHPLRMLLQGSAVAAFWTLYVGDVSSLLAIAPAAVLQARYSRGFEQEADDFAVAMLQANGMSPGLLADALEKLEAHQRKRDGESVNSYLASHPATSERVRHLREQADGT